MYVYARIETFAIPKDSPNPGLAGVQHRACIEASKYPRWFSLLIYTIFSNLYRYKEDIMVFH